MKRLVFGLVLTCFAGMGCAHSLPALSVADAQLEVMATERAFAQTMADRDLEAFASFLADEAIFISDAGPLRGKQAIVDAWSRFYDGEDAPFSWEPDQVEVLESGTLALSTGPVHDPAGKLVARFTSTWRRDAAHTWRIVFDRGNEVCETP